MKKIKVVLCSDEGFAAQIQIAIYSLLKCNEACSGMQIYIIDAGLSAQTKSKLKAMATSFRSELAFLTPPEIDITLDARAHVPASSFYRLYLAQLLPDEDKVIYLDADVLVTGSILPLWECDVSNFYLAGVRDTLTKYVRIATGLRNGDEYINAGVLVCNLALWKRDNLQKLFVREMHREGKAIPFEDQGILNYCCKGRIELLPPTYNLMPDYLRYSQRSLRKLTGNQASALNKVSWDSSKTPVIVHFAGNSYARPWVAKSKHPYRTAYWQTARECGVELHESRYAKAYIIRHIIDKMPQCLQICIRKMAQRRKWKKC